MTKRVKKTKKSEVPANQEAYYIKLIWSAIAVGLIIAALIFVYISKFELPDTEELEKPTTQQINALEYFLENSLKISNSVSDFIYKEREVFLIIEYKSMICFF